MNNLQYIVRNDTRTAMHVAVELCEVGDFDSVTEAFRWLMQERDENGEHEPMTFWPRTECEDVSTRQGVFKCSECGCTVEEGGVDWGYVQYCPDCGKAVKR